MADSVVPRKTIFVSDLTGAEINALDAGTVTIRYADARRGQICARREFQAKSRKWRRSGRSCAAAC